MDEAFQYNIYDFLLSVLINNAFGLSRIKGNYCVRKFKKKKIDCFKMNLELCFDNNISIKKC